MMTQPFNRFVLLRLCRAGFFWLSAAVVLTASAQVSGSELPLSVSNALKDAGISPRNVSVVVQGVEGEQAVIRHNAQQGMNPASTMKLLTTYAALELLGPTYTWKTEVLTDTTPDNGELKGNLYLRGSGDPRLALEQFWLLLRQVRARGVTDISGDLVLDRSAFSLPPHDPAGFDNEPLRPYNAGPDALLINLKSLSLDLQANPEKKTVAVIAETPSDELHIENHLLLTQESCGDWREKIKIKVDAQSIELSGPYAASCNEKTLNLSPWGADRQVEQLFRALWRELGGTLHGKVRKGRLPPPQEY